MLQLYKDDYREFYLKLTIWMDFKMKQKNPINNLDLRDKKEIKKYF